MIQALCFIIIFSFGYYIGLQRHEQDLKLISKRIGRAKVIITGMKNKVTNNPSGIIYRPTAKELFSRKKIDEGDEAFIEGIKEAQKRL